MIAGVVLLILTGFCWIGIAAVVEKAAREHLDLDFIQFASSALIALAAGGAMLFRPPLTGPWKQQVLICGFVFLAGCFNFLMLKLMRCAMRHGNCGAVWGIAQSAMICPFIMGMLLFQVKPTITRLLGIMLVLTGILLFSRRRSEQRRGGSFRWLLPAFGAFAASGVAQCFANLPSYWRECAMSSEWRACLVQLGTIAAFGTELPFRRERVRTEGTRNAVFLLAAVQILTLFFFFYRGLNLVAEHGCGSIGYPVAQGCSIVGFLLFGILARRERGSILLFAAAAAVCCGILLLVL